MARITQPTWHQIVASLARIRMDCDGYEVQSVLVTVDGDQVNVTVTETKDGAGDRVNGWVQNFRPTAQEDSDDHA